MSAQWLQVPVLIFGIGATELILIILVVVLLFGARKIPEIARGLGRSMSEFKKGTREGEAESGKDDKKDQPPAASDSK
jgi:sec-independent protein translocase protein TatA